MKMKRLVSAALAAVVCITSILAAGCGKQNKSKKTISAKDTWYSLKQVNIGEKYSEAPDIDMSHSEFVGYSNDNLIFFVNATRMMPKNIPEGKAVADYIEYSLEILDSNGDIINLIDLKDTVIKSGIVTIPDEEMEKFREGWERAYPKYKDKFVEPTIEWAITNRFDITDKNITVTVESYYPDYDYKGMEARIYKFVFDLTSGELVSVKKKEAAEYFESDDYTSYVAKEFNFEGYNVKTFWSYAEDGETLALTVTTPDGNVTSYPMSELIPDAKVTYVPGMLYLGEGKVFFEAGTDVYSVQRYYEFDLNNGSIKPYLQDVSNIEYDLYNAGYVNGVGNVVPNADGIQKIDVRENKETEVLSFDCCNINRAIVQNLNFLSMNDKKIYMFSESEQRASFYPSSGKEPRKLYILSKEDTNPNAGKKVLNLAYVDYLSYSANEAICEFNETNKDYFIRIDDSYSVDTRITESGINYNDPDFEAKKVKLMSEATYQLYADITVGSGPDIIMNAAKYSNLNSGECFIDLKNEISSDDLFANVLAASETDGKIYQFPLAVKAIGIIARKSDVGADQYGFTFKQYKEFVKGPCNGKDPLDTTQLIFLETCMRSVQSGMTDGKNANFDNEDFRDLAEYTAQNIIDPAPNNEVIWVEPVDSKSFAPTYNEFFGFPYLIYCYADYISDLRVLGVPTREGKGPTLSVDSSVAISAHTKEKDACITFVNVLLSENIQYDYAYGEGYTPVRKTAFEKYGYDTVDDVNKTYERYKEFYEPEELKEYGYPMHTLDRSVVSDYETMIGYCDSILTSDSALDMIVKEEIPAYFAGQKSLDEVIKIINDRAKTYLNERG